MSDDALGAASEVAALLEDLGVPYLIGGSVASTLWGEPRLTLDVDFVAALRDPQVEPLLLLLGDAWYADPVTMREAIERRSSFNLIRLAGMVKVDVFVPPDGGLHESKWGRARRATIEPESGRTVAVTSPEDIVLQKLDWYREGGCVSENQWRDVTALLRVRAGELEDVYLTEWAARLDLTELLGRARAEASD